MFHLQRNFNNHRQIIQVYALDESQLNSYALADLRLHSALSQTLWPNLILI